MLWITTFLRKIVLFHALACNYCNASIEDAKHYFLYCPSFAALRNILLASAAHLLGDTWLSASDEKRIDWLLNGVPDIEFQLMLISFNLSSLLSPNQIVFRNFAWIYFSSFSFSLLLIDVLISDRVTECNRSVTRRKLSRRTTALRANAEFQILFKWKKQKQNKTKQKTKNEKQNKKKTA